MKIYNNQVECNTIRNGLKIYDKWFQIRDIEKSEINTIIK